MTAYFVLFPTPQPITKMLRTFQMRYTIYSITPFLIELYNVSHGPATRCDTQLTPRHQSS